MYFFRVELNSFDDVKKEFYVIPDQQGVDEKGPPFSEKQLVQNPNYKAFVKETKTSVVDVVYTLYSTTAAINGEITDEQFSSMEMDGLLEKLDGNELSIGVKTTKSGGKNNDMMMYAIIGAVIIAVIAFIIAGAVLGGKGKTESTVSDTSSYATSEESGTSETQGTNETNDSDIVTLPVATSEDTPDTATTEEYVDRPMTTEESSYTAESTAEAEYAQETTETATSSSGTSAAAYTISFNANGGEGTMESISSAPEQYVDIPTAEAASAYLSKKGYKLIGFTDNKAFLFPIYDLKMPYSNVVLYAVWEADTYSVNYNSNGGIGQVSRANVKYGDEVPLPSAAIYKDGYELLGWNTSKTAKTALKSYKMPYENTTLYAVWSKEKQTAKITLHYDDEIIVLTETIGTALDMNDSFGAEKDGYIVSGWYLNNTPLRLDYLEITENCDVYAKWERATYITITIDQSYLNKEPLKYKAVRDMNGEAMFRMPVIDDKNDVYSHVYGCTYGFSTKAQSGDFGTIKYYSDTEYKFTDNITLYRVLNKYGGGKGTQADPYIIDYYDQLLYLGENKASGYFKQTADIKFPSKTEKERKSINTITIGKGFSDKFYDFFEYDGQGYKIKNLNGSGGLFGTIAASTVKNVVIENATISANTENCGILCNEVSTYSFSSDENPNIIYGTGNTKIIGCKVINGKINVNKAADNVGGIVGFGGDISECYAKSVSIYGYSAIKAVGGIVGSSCNVTGCIANNIFTEGEIVAAGGIAGEACGMYIRENGSTNRLMGGNIVGCGVRTFTSTAQSAGGIVGRSTATVAAYIKSCYVANLFLNGTTNGSISGSDGYNSYGHIIAYCIVDNTNGYSFIGGNGTRSKAKAMVLNVPADSGLTVDGVLSVLNAEGSGYDRWCRSSDVNGGYAYPKNMTF